MTMKSYDLKPSEKTADRLVKSNTILIIILSFLLVAFQTVFIILMIRDNTKNSGAEIAAPDITLTLNEASAAGDTVDDVSFILGESNGKVAIMSSDGSTVYSILDVYIDTLPEADRHMLKSGIAVRDNEELQSLIEDYSS